MAVPKVAAIHDISGLGRCSLTAAIPILSVCGVQAIPLPTAVLSNQTAFDSYEKVDLSLHLPRITEEWGKRGLELQGIFTGYLSEEKQVQFVEDFIDKFCKPDTLVLVDPVLGDDGSFYKGFGESMLTAMKRLCHRADVITPNFTEALMLLGQGQNLPQEQQLEKAKEAALSLTKLGPKTVVVTGVHHQGRIWNVGYSVQKQQWFTQSSPQIGGGYSGTGDILSSVICGCMVRGESAEKALQRAVELLEAALNETVQDGSEPKEGIVFEHYLHLLME